MGGVKQLKRFLNSIFNPISDSNPFWNPPKIDKYNFVSREERRDTLEKLQQKYPEFRRAYKLHQWIELWNGMNIQDEEYKNAFLRYFEDVIQASCVQIDVEAVTTWE